MVTLVNKGAREHHVEKAEKSADEEAFIGTPFDKGGLGQKGDNSRTCCS